MILWGTLLVVGILTLTFILILLTDGRYFGKPLVYWIYDHLGQTLFRPRDDTQCWRTLAARIPLRGDESILDVGTAVGALPLALASMPDFWGRVTGVDWSPRMMDAARSEGERRGVAQRADFHVVDVREGLPFDAQTFDVLFCLGLLETWRHPQSILHELVRVLKPDGSLVLSLYRRAGMLGGRLRREWYQTHLEKLGYGEVRVVPCRHTHDAIIARP